MAEQGLPTTYETTTHTTQPTLSFHKEYITSLPGILKVAEIVLGVVVFLCSVSTLWRSQGWVDFVSLSSFFCTLALFILHGLSVISRLPGPWKIIEFVYYCIFTAMYVIAAIVAAAQASGSGAVGACAFFAFAATAVYAVDTFFQFRAYRSGQATMTTTTTTTTTTAASPGGQPYYPAGGQPYNPEAAKTTY